MPDPQRFLVGVHFHRHFGGPGHVTVAPGLIVLTDRRAKRHVTHTGTVVRVERKRFEPPTGNHWIQIVDAEHTGYCAVSRKRAEKVLDAMMACGFTIEHVGH